ncbi:hypothetical protein [Nocardioides marmotae]|uniref:Integral membrane protein n=1 Tax=Nocardioides marmotae TaxID=2663857 RepID=A0A6I3J0W8_9ACTN|nr:hypothetical protein [Nocardioides marmotae]MCR6031004.1 hypothetical protein [Gordonia jinghuaiqii]MBC9731717.1 hypothetical protein [Nocardioides marmotae]MTB82839.1 hypothetical protein [Nocardioides marmotae]MTB94641.1 hypothetical protein [Nocardioides marmotae]QKE01351.1 hypothetical protein HPC71_09925 [Nocardioides marmotae]
MAERAEALSHGWGRVLVAVYAVFAVASTGRSLVQLGTKADEAPLAYTLSLVAALVYVAATTCLLVGGRRGWWAALVAVAVEAVGVLAVGTLSYVSPELFPDRTVWSHFGQGYGFLPLVLPFLGIAWLRHTRWVAAGPGAPEGRSPQG